MKTRPFVFALTLLATPVLHAQFIVDGATNTLNNFTNSFPGGVTVGSNSSFSLLVLSNHVQLANALDAFIGLNSTAKSNEVRLLSSSDRWQNGNNLYVGSNGAVSRLVVSNGATVEDLNSYLAYRAASSNNFALVTGSGSLWTNRGDLRVGNLGAGNQLIVSNGGWVASRFGYVAGANSSSNNFALVTGSGSVWSNQFDLTVGFGGRSNRMVIEAGGLVVCDNGYISDLGGSNNEALVTDPGTVWSNRTRLVVGLNSTVANHLTVSNGAVVWCGSPSGGGGPGGTSNLVVITGTGSLWTNQGDWTVGGIGNRVDVNNGGWVANINSFISSSNTVILNGNNSGWNNRGDLQMGYFGDGNALIASNGATLLSSNTLIGASTSLGNNNSALLSGAGTVWSNRNDFTVGSFGFNNGLSLSNGATLYTGGNAVVGANGSGNVARVLDSTTRWLVGSSLYVGSNSSFNEIIVADGGLVTTKGTEVGSEIGGSNNLALVIGAGSVWSNQSPAFVIGRSGGGNVFSVSDGGHMESGIVDIGVNFSAGNNVAQVTGLGASWIASEIVVVGDGGSGNSLLVSDGGQLRTTAGAEIGFTGNNNLVLVTDAGSSWTNPGPMSVGVIGDGNQLVVSNQASVFTEGILVGGGGNATSNRVVVHGGTLSSSDSGVAALEVRRGTNVFNAGLIDVDQLRLTNTHGFFEFNGGTLISRGADVNNGAAFFIGNSATTPAIWDVRAGLISHFVNAGIIVGPNSSLNQLLITNGGTLVNNGTITLGSLSGANSNSAIIAGTGSEWLLALGMFIGAGGSGNLLVVSNGAQVAAAGPCVLGQAFGSANNEAAIADPGSIWTMIGSLTVGNVGHDNRLMMSDGAQVNNQDGFIGGPFPSSSNNLAAVTGAGTLWSNLNSLYIGTSANGNQLGVNGGATIYVGGDGVLGYNTGANSNLVSVAGPATRWLISSNLYVGNDGLFNRLVISNGATVSDDSAAIGQPLVPFSGGSNEVLVTGVGTLWSNANTLSVGWTANGNRLVISNGAVVSSLVGNICQSVSSNNVVVVTDPGSLWTNQFAITTGFAGPLNRLIVTNSGVVDDADGSIGGVFLATNCDALVTGPGSLWRNRSTLNVGAFGGFSRLVVTNNGTATALTAIVLGLNLPSTNNLIVVDGGVLRATNAAGTATLDLRRGTNVLNAGLIEVDQLLATNSASRFEFNGGTLSVKSTRANNGTQFRIGNGLTPATFALAGNNLHEFAPLLLHPVSANATLTGNGTIAGLLQFAAGSRLMPGTPIGKLVFGNSPSLQGATLMEISKNGAILTNDQIQVMASLTYGGSLIVSNIGPTAPAAGDRFPLFIANGFAGGFTNLTLPPLASGLDWTNKLLVDGSIEVIDLNALRPKFTSVQRSGGNLILSGSNGSPHSTYAVLSATNAATPLSNWVSLATNQFDGSGSFSFTNPISSTEPRRFFRIRTP